MPSRRPLTRDLIWMESAACRRMGTDLFFPEPDDTETIEQAIQVCRRCPVRQECLSYARRTGTEYGVWGGVFLG